jgi:polyhydroxyalkanoate synthesis regulator phasin
MFMERISIKAYAVKHKLSIFNVMKMVKSGKVKSEVLSENERDVTYILYDEETEKEIIAQIIPLENKAETDIRNLVESLRKEVKLLRAEVEALKKQIQ